jgi:hypothetical protein
VGEGPHGGFDEGEEGPRLAGVAGGKSDLGHKGVPLVRVQLVNLKIGIMLAVLKIDKRIFPKKRSSRQVTLRHPPRPPAADIKESRAWFFARIFGCLGP